MKTLAVSYSFQSTCPYPGFRLALRTERFFRAHSMPTEITIWRVQSLYIERGRISMR